MTYNEKKFLREVCEAAKSRLNPRATLRFWRYVTPAKVLRLLDELEYTIQGKRR